MKQSIFFSLFLMLHFISFSQKDAAIKYGKISSEDFVISSPVVDSNANAVIIADIGSIEFEGTSSGWFRSIFKRHKRVKIINKKGFDIATIKIHLYKYSNDNQEKIADIKGATFNIENGNVVSTKLNSKSFITEKIDTRHSVEKFTFENIKEGSIIEYSYEMTSDFISSLQDWYFQDYYPTLWSELEVRIPEFLDYKFISTGLNNPFKFKESISNEKFKITRGVQNGLSNSTNLVSMGSGRLELDARVYNVKWVLKDMPGLKVEPFTTSLQNHISKINFQLAQIKMPEQLPEDVVQSWEQIADKRNKDERFGEPINNQNNWLDADMQKIIGNAGTEDEKARKIFAFVRNNFTKKSNGTMLSVNTTLKDIFKNKSGSVADINLLLIAMLRHEKINASPILLSTRNNGFINATYPIMDQFNYLICVAIVDEKEVYLDATENKLGFGKLPLHCYNGDARVFSVLPSAINFSADSLKDLETTVVNIFNNEKGKIEGSVTKTMSYYNSLSFRENNEQVDLKKTILKSFLSETVIDSISIESYDDFESPISVSYSFNLGDINDDIIYFSPMLTEAWKENPFKSAKRYYPVELPHCISETYMFSMEVPKGYTVDEMPKSTRVLLNGESGVFKYIAKNQNNVIEIQSELKINKANFRSEDYESIRNFFLLVVKKHAEQIVFKKNK